MKKVFCALLMSLLVFPSLWGADAATTLPTSNRDVFDYVISYWDTVSTDIVFDKGRAEKMEEAIQNWAVGTYATTRGAHKLGRIAIVQDGKRKNDALMLWKEKPSGSDAKHGAAQATPGGYPYKSNKSMASNIITWDSMVGAYLPSQIGYALTHEAGHFVYKLDEEYDNTPVHRSAMANDYEPRSFIFSTKEHLDKTRLDNSGNLNTSQFQTYGMSCWEILLAPTDPPSAATFFPEYSRVRYTNLRFNPTPTSYADAIVPFPIINNQVYNDTTSKEAKLNWANVPQAVKDPLKIIWAYGDAVMLVIDQSGSMEGGPMELAKKAAKRFVKELPGGTALGLIAFSNSARLLVSPAPLPGGFLSFFGGRSQYTNLIGDLQASGNTAMYDAVRLACSELTAKYPGRWKTVVLISDGQDNSSSASLNRIISDYKDNINVYTVGTGEGYDRGALTALAGNMNGEFKDATPKNFNDVMDSVAESSGVNKIVDDIIKSRTVLSRSAAARMLTPLSAARGDVAAKEFFIDDSVAAAIVSVAYNGVAGDISCALRDPSGNAFAGEVKDDGGEWMAVIANPAVGRWTLDITYNTARDMNVEFDVVAHLREGKSGYGVSFGFLGDQVFLSEIDARNGAAYLGLGVQKEGEPLTDVDLTTTITHPSGRVEEVTFTDAEKSGIYSLLFDSFSTNGVYQVDVKASNASGNAKITYRGYSDQDETQDPLFPMTDNFEIVHHAQFWVTGADRMVPVSGIYLSSSSFELGVGESGVLTAEISPENATNQELDWMSMDNSVASVNKNTGVVTGMGVGTTQIYAIAHNNVQVECTVTVTATYTPPSTPQAVSPIDGEELTEGIITLLATPFNSADGLTQIGSQWSIHSPEGEELLDEILEVPGNSYEIEASLSAGGINLDRLDAQWRVRYFYETPDNTGAATDWSDWASFSIVKRSSSHHSSGCSTYGLGVWAVVFMSFVLLKRLRKQ